MSGNETGTRALGAASPRPMPTHGRHQGGTELAVTQRLLAAVGPTL